MQTENTFGLGRLVAAAVVYASSATPDGARTEPLPRHTRLLASVLENYLIRQELDGYRGVHRYHTKDENCCGVDKPRLGMAKISTSQPRIDV